MSFETKEDHMEITDIARLVMLTVLFIAFAATMVWAEIVFRRHLAAEARATASRPRKRRPF